MCAVSAHRTGPVPRHALRRGTRGFAAFVLFLTAWIVLAIALFVLPSSTIGHETLVVLVPLGIAFGLAHFVALAGVLRRRAWSVPLTLYLTAIGLGMAAFVVLLVGTGVDPLARPGSVTTFGTRAVAAASGSPAPRTVASPPARVPGTLTA